MPRESLFLSVSQRNSLSVTTGSSRRVVRKSGRGSTEDQSRLTLAALTVAALGLVAGSSKSGNSYASADVGNATVAR